MLDYAPPMYDSYPAPPARLDNFPNIFNKTPFNYYPCNYDYSDSDTDPAAAIYHSLMTVRDTPKDDWRNKLVEHWTEHDTYSWIVDVTHPQYPEFNIPYYNFQVTGQELKDMSRDEIYRRFLQLDLDPSISSCVTENVLEKLRCKLDEEVQSRQPSVIQSYNDIYPHNVELMNLDPPKDDSYNANVYSSDERESESPVNSNGSEGFKSGDEDDKRTVFKRPPGRPKGSGRGKVPKRPRNVSVPEFLRDLLSDPHCCPSIIKWEDYSQRKFRFVKPDEVSKLWGKLKQNDGMTFEKFSRAMRYHYRQAVLVSVPTARLVYQFGVNGPKCVTDNPNFTKFKTEDIDYNP